MSGLHRALKTPFVCLQRFCILSQEKFSHICLEQEKERSTWINNCIDICWLVPSTVLSTLHLLNALALTITLYNTCNYPHFMVKGTGDTERLLLAPGHTADLWWGRDLFQAVHRGLHSDLSSVNKCPHADTSGQVCIFRPWTWNESPC